MSNSIHSIQAVNAQAQTQQAVQPPKNQQTTAQPAIPQDTVTISQSAKQAQAVNTKAAAGGDVDHDGDSH
jgi:hypothetical protein